MRKIETITEENFTPFGCVLTFSRNPRDTRFEIKEIELTESWRIAVFRVTIKKALRLECHPTSKESFTPISGIGLLLVAEPNTPEDYHVFLLDKSICLNKGVWHEVISLSDEALYQITENAEVHSDFFDFTQPVCAGVIEERMPL